MLGREGGSVRRSGGSESVTLTPFLAVLIALAFTGNARAEIASDNTRTYVGATLVLTLMAIIVLAIRWNSLRKREGSRTWPLAVLSGFLVVLVVVQASFINSYQPWYEAKADEENAKVQFNYYLPKAEIANLSIDLSDDPIEDIDAAYFNGSLVMVYSVWESDKCYLKVANTTELDGWRKGKVLDHMTSIARSRWDYKIIYNITLEESNDTLFCYYTMDQPGGLDIQQARMVSTTDGWNWTERKVIQGYQAGPNEVELDLPLELSDFGWTHVESHYAVDLGDDGVVLSVHYGGHGIDWFFDRGVYFIHSWNGVEWSDLVLLTELADEWSAYTFHKLVDGSYLGIDVHTPSYGSTVRIIEFTLDDFYDVNGPVYGRQGN